VIFAYTLTLLVTALLTRMLWRARRLYRQQALAIPVSVAAPLIANVAYNTRLGPMPHLDMTPFAFTVTERLEPAAFPFQGPGAHRPRSRLRQHA
jgi:hypothetical protein